MQGLLGTQSNPTCTQIHLKKSPFITFQVNPTSTVSNTIIITASPTQSNFNLFPSIQISILVSTFSKQPTFSFQFQQWESEHFHSQHLNTFTISILKASDYLSTFQFGLLLLKYMSTKTAVKIGSKQLIFLKTILVKTRDET